MSRHHKVHSQKVGNTNIEFIAMNGRELYILETSPLCTLKYNKMAVLLTEQDKQQVALYFPELVCRKAEENEGLPNEPLVWSPSLVEV